MNTMMLFALAARIEWGWRRIKRYRRLGNKLIAEGHTPYSLELRRLHKKLDDYCDETQRCQNLYSILSGSAAQRVCAG